MATFTGTNANDRADATTGTLTGYTGGTQAELQDANGDRFFSNNGNDTVVAGAGDDTLDGSAGADSMVGGAGSDVFIYFSAADLTGDFIDGGAANAGFGDMIQLAFGGTADLTGMGFFSTGTTSIEYLALFGGTGHTVILNGGQIGANRVSSTLGIQGDGGTDILQFNNVQVSFDIGGFTFALWDQPTDKIVINIAAAGADVTGSSVADEILGAAGDDQLEGGTGADTLRGGGGNDEFRYLSQAQITGDIIDGGASAGPVGDSLQINYAGVADFTGVSISSAGSTSIESIYALLGGGHDIIFDTSQFNTTGLSTTLFIQGGATGLDRLIINNAGLDADFSGLLFSDWDQAGDRVVINAAAGGASITGTVMADEVNGGAANDLIVDSLSADTLRGGGGNDVIRYTRQVAINNDSIDGGADADELQIAFAGTADFSTVTIASTATTSIEKLTFVGAGGHEGIFLGSQVGATGLSEQLGVRGVASSVDVLRFNDIQGSVAFTGFTFSDWLEGTDQIVLTGGAGAESIFGTGIADIFRGSLGADELRGQTGSDRFIYGATVAATGDTIDGGPGGAGGDIIELTGSLSLAGATIESIERLQLTGGVAHDVTLTGAQFTGGTGFALNLAVDGDNAGIDTITVNNVGVGVGLFTLGSLVLTNWEARDTFVLNVTQPGIEVIGTSANDVVNGSTGRDIIRGTLGNDRLVGNAARDDFIFTANAQIGTDTIDGGQQEGIIGDLITVAFDGLADFRTATIASTGVTSIELLLLSSTGDHDVRLASGQFGGNGLSADLAIQGNAGVDSITFDVSADIDASTIKFSTWTGAVDRVTLNGGTGANAITGTGEADVILGGAGNDTLTGGAGSDSLTGGADVDTVSYATSAARVLVDLAAGTGAGGDAQGDVYATIESATGSNFNDALTGSAEANRLIGLIGSDTLLGGAGNDTLEGGQDDDFLFGGAFAAGGAFTSATGADSLIGGAGIDRAWGMDGDDIMRGDADDDFLTGGAGNDTLAGGANNDFLFGGDFVGGTFGTGSGNDNLDGGDGLDALYGFDGDDIIVTGIGDDYVEGGDGQDSIVGGSGNSFLQGGTGSDTLTGGGGFDYLYGQGGADLFSFRTGDSYDWVLDFSVGEGDRLRLDPAFGITSFGAFQSAIVTGATFTILTVNGGLDQLTLFGVGSGQWTAGMVEFL